MKSVVTTGDLYPCDLVPTESLRIRTRRATPLPTSQQTQSSRRGQNSATATQQQLQQYNRTYVPLPESSGTAILRYVYDLYSLLGDIPVNCGVMELPGDSFFGISSSSNLNSNIPKQMMSLMEKGRFLQSIRPCPENIPRITRPFLQRHGVTINILLTKCAVPIIDLWSAGICATLDDLCDLGFQMTDLTNKTGNKKLFNVNHMMQLFKANGAELAAHPVIQLDIRHLIAVHFDPAELEALEISLPCMIEKNQITLGNLNKLAYSPTDLCMLGVRRKHLCALGLTTQQLAKQHMQWAPSDFNMFQ